MRTIKLSTLVESCLLICTTFPEGVGKIVAFLFPYLAKALPALVSPPLSKTSPAANSLSVLIMVAFITSEVAIGALVKL